jgi:addiction module HigA family antidote
MMHNPPHPGEFIREICLEPLNLTVTDAAKKLGVTRKALSELLNGKTGISTEMSLRLAEAFNTTPESWLTQQMHYDLWVEQKKDNDLGVSKVWKGKRHVEKHTGR